MINEYLSSIIVLTIAVLPVLAWRPTRSLSIVLIVLYLAFLVIHWPFVMGVAGTVHDTENGYLKPFILYKQWLDAGIKLGWNPYWGGGQPFELLNNFVFLPTYAPLLLINSVLGLQLDPIILFNWSWILLHLLMCTGATLAASSILKSRWSCLFVTTPLLFGSFWGGLIAPVPPVVLCFSVYLLFFWYNAWKEKSFAWLILFVAATAFSLNFYIPHYVLITLVISITSFCIFKANKQAIFHQFKELIYFQFLNKSIILKSGVLLVVFALFASPFIHMFIETLDFVSPTRGFTVQGEMSLTNDVFQQGVGVNLSSWTLLTDRTVGYDRLNFDLVMERAHWPMYIGAVATTLCAYGLVSLSITWVVLTAAILTIISFGPDSWLWDFLISYVPFMDLVRHSFPFVGVVVFLFLIVGASVIENQTPFRQNVVNLVLNYLCAVLLLAILIVAALTDLQVWSWIANPVVFGGLAAVLLGLYILINTKFHNIRYAKSLGTVSLLLLLIFECGSVALGRADRFFRYPSPSNVPEVKEFVYPTQWQSINSEYRMPFDWDAMFSKQAIWLSLTNDSMFLLQKDFARYARNKYSCHPTKNCSKADLSKVNLAETSLIGANPRAANVRSELGGIFVLYPHDSSNEGKNYLKSVGSDLFFDSPLKVTKSSSSPNELKTVCSVLLIVRDPEESLALPDKVKFRQLGTNIDQLGKGNLSAFLKRGYAGQDLLVKQYELDSCLEGGAIRTDVPLTIDHPSIEVDVRIILLEDPDLDFVVPLESHNPNSIRLLAHSHAKSLLLRKENYHPNWNLTVNHAPHKIDRTSENFQIISLDPGVNDLVFTYESIYDLLHKFTLYGLFFFYFCMIIVLSFNNSDPTRKFQKSLLKEPRTD